MTPPTIMPNTAKMYTPMMVDDSKSRSRSRGFDVETESLGICRKPMTETMTERLRMMVWVPLQIQNILVLKSSWSFMTKKMMRMTIPPTRHNRPKNKPLEADRQSTCKHKRGHVMKDQYVQ